jgi:four helix bundle protein
VAFRYRKFKFFQDSKRLHKEVVFLVSTFTYKYYYLSDQLKRSSLSVVLNIAEGSSKQSDKDFNRFLTIALGSVDETVAALEVGFELGIISGEKYVSLTDEYEVISRQLGGMSKMLKVSSYK